MNLEEKAKEYGNTFWTDKESAKEDFQDGAEWLRSELLLFLAANPRAANQQITDYLNSL